MRVLRPLVTLAGLLALWQVFVWSTGVAPYILPGPERVLAAALRQPGLLAAHAAVTALEIALGLLLGAAFGGASALAMARLAGLRRWLLPVLVASQAVPVFALAPVLVLWFGYGLLPKVLTAALIVYFPVTAAVADGLRRIDPGWLDLARSMGATPASLLRQVRLPAALPALASGLRIAAAVAPIGAVIGEWVGAASGLGYLMLQANARVQTDLMFAALLLLMLLGAALYFGLDALLRRALPWQPESEPTRLTS